jgi:hypothetical protein
MTTYTRPSECTQCVPVETLTNDSGISWTIETAHQAACPNNLRRAEGA